MSKFLLPVTGEICENKIEARAQIEEFRNGQRVTVRFSAELKDPKNKFERAQFVEKICAANEMAPRPPAQEARLVITAHRLGHQIQPGQYNYKTKIPSENNTIVSGQQIYIDLHDRSPKIDEVIYSPLQIDDCARSVSRMLHDFYDADAVRYRKPTSICQINRP